MGLTETLNTTALPGVIVANGGHPSFHRRPGRVADNALEGILGPEDATTFAVCASIIAGGASLTGIASSTLSLRTSWPSPALLIAFITATIGARCILVHQPRSGRRTTTQTDSQEETGTNRLMELVCGECQARGALPGECNHIPQSPGPWAHPRQRRSRNRGEET